MAPPRSLRASEASEPRALCRSLPPPPGISSPSCCSASRRVVAAALALAETEGVADGEGDAEAVVEVARLHSADLASIACTVRSSSTPRGCVLVCGAAAPAHAEACMGSSRRYCCPSPASGRHKHLDCGRAGGRAGADG